MALSTKLFFSFLSGIPVIKTRLCHFWALGASILFIAVNAEAVVVKLAWDAPTNTTGITGYNVYYKAPSSSAYTFLDSTTGLSLTYNQTTINPGTYDFVVRSKNSSNQESVDSNRVTSTLFSLNPLLQANAGLPANRTFTIGLFNAGTTTAISATSSIVANSSGVLFGYSLAGAIAGNVDIQIKTNKFLTRKKLNHSFASPTALPALPAGDLDNNNVINSIDANTLSINLGTPNAVADIDANGVVNNVDANALSSSIGLAYP